MPPHVAKSAGMPIPPVKDQTEFIDAGPICFGVEYRLLTDAIVKANPVQSADGTDKGPEELDDRGVSIHVYGRQDGESSEYLRFDCFEEDPHYHYISWKDKSNEMVRLDPIADGDPLQWALERLRLRLIQMLERAGAGQLASTLDPRSIDAVMPRVTEAAYRARYHHNDGKVLQNALKPG